MSISSCCPIRLFLFGVQHCLATFRMTRPIHLHLLSISNELGSIPVHCTVKLQAVHKIQYNLVWQYTGRCSIFLYLFCNTSSMWHIFISSLSTSAVYPSKSQLLSPTKVPPHRLVVRMFVGLRQDLCFSEDLVFRMQSDFCKKKSSAAVLLLRGGGASRIFSVAPPPPLSIAYTAYSFCDPSLPPERLLRKCLFLIIA